MAERWPRVGVIGGSLAGLTAGHLLRDLGCAVTVYERSNTALEARGAGIAVLPETSRYLRERLGVPLDSITCATRHVRYLDQKGEIIHEEVRPYRFTGWRTIYARLLCAFDSNLYRLNSEVTGFDCRGGGGEVSLTLTDGSEAIVDLLVCADGIGSRSRTKLLPTVVPNYAGYVAWRGIVEEAALSARSQSAFADALVYQLLPASHILVYPIPSADGATATGQRLLNFVWYRNYAPGATLNSLMTDRQGSTRDRTLPPGALREEHLQEARSFARANLAPPLAELVAATSEPFVQAIVDVEVPRMAFGRICLIGDAAFALRPHIGAGTAKAAADAWALADALASTNGAVGPALRILGTRAIGGRSPGARARSLQWQPLAVRPGLGTGRPFPCLWPRRPAS